jgi:type VI protein secretion system component VasK
MNNSAFFFVEIVLVFGGALAWCCWELWSVRRSQARDREAAAERARQADEEHRPDEG